MNSFLAKFFSSLNKPKPEAKVDAHEVILTNNQGQKLANSLCVMLVLDYLPPSKVVSLQALNHFHYDSLIPLYCGNRSHR